MTMTMNYPLANFCQNLLLSCNTPTDPSNVKIIQDNCGKLTEEARGLVRLSYRSSITSDTACSRWDTCEKVLSTLEKKFEAPPNNMEGTTKDTMISCHLPSRRTSLVESVARVLAVDTIPHMPPRNATELSTRRWAMALDDLSGSVSSDYDSDDYSDSDSETTYTATGLDFDSDLDGESDESDDEEEEDDDDCHHRSKVSKSTSSTSTSSNRSCRWGGAEINAHEWSFPPNTILPNLQDMFREAALNRDVDINQRIRELAMSGLTQVQ